MPVEDVVTAVKDHKLRAPGISMMRDYEAGKHRYPFASPAFIKDYSWVLSNAVENMIPAILHSFVDLVTIQSWAGAGAKAAQELGETLGLSRVINLTVREAHRAGDGYVLVWPNTAGVLCAWYHRADQVAYRASEDDPDAFAWVAKLWTIDTDDMIGFGRVNVYYQDRCERWITNTRVRYVTESPTIETRTASDSWPDRPEAFTPYAGDDGGPTLTHDFGTPPWVHLAFDADTQGGHGRSVLRDVVPLQDGLNKSVADLIVGSEAFARPLRALMNYEPTIKIDPATGLPVEDKLVMDPTKQSIIGVRGPGPLTQLDQADATKLTAVQDSFALKMGRVVGLPPTDILPTLGNVPSGAALRILANRRTKSVLDFETDNTPALTRLLGLLGVDDAVPEWVDPAPMDSTERLAIAQARVDLGYPLAEVLPDLGETPEDISRILQAAETARSNAGALAVAAFRAGQDPAAVLMG